MQSAAVNWKPSLLLCKPEAVLKPSYDPVNLHFRHFTVRNSYCVLVFRHRVTVESLWFSIYLFFSLKCSFMLRPPENIVGKYHSLLYEWKDSAIFTQWPFHTGALQQWNSSKHFDKSQQEKHRFKSWNERLRHLNRTQPKSFHILKILNIWFVNADFVKYLKPSFIRTINQ